MTFTPCRRLSAALLLVLTGAGCCPFGWMAGRAQRHDLEHDPLVDLAAVDSRLVIELRYATENNFTGRRLYSAARCLLRRSAAERLVRVADRLEAEGLRLKVYDAYRPLAVQHELWRLVPDERYVAHPRKGSRHNRGAAVDVTLVDADGRELEMPTAYDDFTEAAHRDYAGGTEASRRNRDILAAAMEAEGFAGLPTEWWHFDAPGWESCRLLDIPLGEVETPPTARKETSPP